MSVIARSLLGGAVAGVLLTYLAFAFAFWSFDAVAWGQQARVAMIVISLPAGTVLAGFCTTLATVKT